MSASISAIFRRPLSLLRRRGAAHELKLEGFSDWLGMRRFLLGAVLMRFGAMLAGGCAVGAGVTGASVFALTAWLVVGGMWFGAGLTDLFVDRGGMPQSRQAINSQVRGTRTTI